MIVGVILAGGKGTRMDNKEINKTAINFREKPLVSYGVESFKKVVNKTLIVIGHKHKTVQDALRGESVEYVFQKRRLGTGHALKTAIEHLRNKNETPEIVVVGNGDNMLFYTKKMVSAMIRFHKKQKAVVTILIIKPDNASLYDNGRILRKKDGCVAKIIESKHASAEELTINELNTGFYCFDYKFVSSVMKKLPRNEISGEYQITDFIYMANDSGKKVSAFLHDNPLVGMGINTKLHLDQLLKKSWVTEVI